MFKNLFFGCMPNLKTNRKLSFNIIECIGWNKKCFRQLRLEVTTKLFIVREFQLIPS